MTRNHIRAVYCRRFVLSRPAEGCDTMREQGLRSAGWLISWDHVTFIACNHLMTDHYMSAEPVTYTTLQLSATDTTLSSGCILDRSLVTSTVATSLKGHP